MDGSGIDPRIRALCEGVTKARARVVIDHILQHGSVTTEELQSLYALDHPPRAVQDVKEAGIPIEMFKVRSERTGRKIAAYRFGDPSKIRNGRIDGRKAFSKKFKEALLARYGEADALTGQRLEGRYLQIDHRIPYQVAGDDAHDETNLDAYMLLDASSQRAKSWSCESCRNGRELKDADICRGCYWAFPENYTHIAMMDQRRVDVVWSGAEVKAFEELHKKATASGLSLSEMLKKLGGSDS